jgi:hypothetical protein
MDIRDKINFIWRKIKNDSWLKEYLYEVEEDLQKRIEKSNEDLTLFDIIENYYPLQPIDGNEEEIKEFSVNIILETSPKFEEIFGEIKLDKKEVEKTIKVKSLKYPEYKPSYKRCKGCSKGTIYLVLNMSVHPILHERTHQIVDDKKLEISNHGIINEGLANFLPYYIMANSPKYKDNIDMRLDLYNDICKAIYLAFQNRKFLPKKDVINKKPISIIGRMCLEYLYQKEGINGIIKIIK